jgi:hypothetical protein
MFSSYSGRKIKTISSLYTVNTCWFEVFDFQDPFTNVAFLLKTCLSFQVDSVFLFCLRCWNESYCIAAINNDKGNEPNQDHTIAKDKVQKSYKNHDFQGWDNKAYVTHIEIKYNGTREDPGYNRSSTFNCES